MQTPYIKKSIFFPRNSHLGAIDWCPFLTYGYNSNICANNGNQNNHNNNGQHYRRDFSHKHHEHVKANETLEDIQRDIRRIEKEIEMEISEISAAKLGV